MKIGVDIRLFAEGRRSGVEEYTEKILKHLLEIDSENSYVFFLNAFHAEAGKERIQKLCDRDNVDIKVLNIPNKILNSSFIFLKRPQIDKLLGGLDIFFSPNLMFGSFSSEVKRVLTIHDLSFEVYPEFFSKKQQWWHSVVNPKRQIEESSQIISVSEATKTDLIEIYDVPAEKISVIHSGVKKVQCTKDQAVLDKYKIKGEYILFFATLEPRKNPLGIISAYERFRTMINDPVKMVFAGSKGWLDAKIRKAHEASEYHDDIIFTGPVSDSEKDVLYASSKMLLYPSLYEGFGFPPLEAMQCGIPVITSSGSSIPEIVGKGALLVDPYDIEGIAQAITELHLDNALREFLIKKSKRCVDRYSWENAARKTLKVLENV
ncbi:glycosyltransferase family 4 protein [Patescibacteria group bacterium]